MVAAVAPLAEQIAEAGSLRVGELALIQVVAYGGAKQRKEGKYLHVAAISGRNP